jgi:uncharacterized protein (DUF58 family)
MSFNSTAPAAAQRVAKPPQTRRKLRWPRLNSRRLARYNHILVPGKKAERDRLRRTLIGRILTLVFATIRSYSREGRVLWLLAVPVGCAGMDVYFSQTHQLFAILVGLLLASALVRPWFRVPGLRATVRAPTRVTIGAPARFDICLCNDGRAHLSSLRVERPFLPWDGRWQGEAAAVASVAPGERACVSAEATFVARGEHHLDAFEVGALVPLGLAVGPRCATDGPRFLVVPQVANLVKVEVSHRAHEQCGAAASSRQPGETDIAGVRPYRAGDPFKHIHARTWARTGVPHVRQYLEERSDSVLVAVLVDGSGASERTKEATLSAAAGVAARLTLHGGGLDTLLIDDEPFSVFPHTGSRALDTVLDRLAVHELTSSERPVLGALRERLAMASSLLLLTAGAPARGRILFEAAQAQGVPCRWAMVVDAAGADAATPGESLVITEQAVEEGRPISL